MEEYITTIINLITIDLADVILILLSIGFPLIIAREEQSRKTIDKLTLFIFSYLNKNELNKREVYFQWLDSMSSREVNMVNFLTSIEINDNNPLLLSGRSGDENKRIRGWQKKIKKASKLLNVLSIAKYFVVLVVIIILLFTK